MRAYETKHHHGQPLRGDTVQLTEIREAGDHQSDRLMTPARDELVRATVPNPNHPGPRYLAGDRDPIVHRQSPPTLPRRAFLARFISDDQPTAIAGSNDPAVLQTFSSSDRGRRRRVLSSAWRSLNGPTCLAGCCQLANDKDPSVRAAARSNDRFEEKGVAEHAGLLAGPD
jgi:hypothetical protein